MKLRHFLSALMLVPAMLSHAAIAASEFSGLDAAQLQQLKQRIERQHVAHANLGKGFLVVSLILLVLLLIGFGL